jgi:ATP-dependent Clp protease ATP-binding subunit ClpC
MTSNIGAKLISNTGTKALGFSGNENGGVMSQNAIKEAVTGELKKCFRPEFLNRVDDIIVFEQLSKENIKEIAGRLLDVLSKRVSEMGIEIGFDASAVEKIVALGGTAEVIE